MATSGDDCRRCSGIFPLHRLDDFVKARRLPFIGRLFHRLFEVVQEMIDPIADQVTEVAKRASGAIVTAPNLPMPCRPFPYRL